jgi:hypothetical protein
MRERLNRRREQRQAVLRVPNDVEIDLAVKLTRQDVASKGDGLKPGRKAPSNGTDWVIRRPQYPGMNARANIFESD